MRFLGLESLWSVVREEGLLSAALVFLEHLRSRSLTEAAQLPCEPWSKLLQQRNFIGIYKYVYILYIYTHIHISYTCFHIGVARDPYETASGLYIGSFDHSSCLDFEPWT